jgi:hypothetical protein
MSASWDSRLETLVCAVTSGYCLGGLAGVGVVDFDGFEYVLDGVGGLE